MADSDNNKKKEGGPEPEQSRFLHRVVLFDGLTVLILLGVLAFWYAAGALLLVFAGVLLAILLYEVSARLQRRIGLPRGLALALVLVALLLLCVLAGWLAAPRVAQQMSSLAQAVPDALLRLRQEAEKLGIFGPLAANLPSVEDVVSQLSSILPKAGLFFSGIVGALGSAAIILFVGIYFAAQPQVYIEGLVTLAPRRHRRRAREVLEEIGRTLAQWLLGKVLSMIVVGVVTGIALALLGNPLALILGIITGALDFIPYLGPIMAGVPAVLIAFTESPAMALYTALVFVAVQMAEGYLLLPLVERRTVSLPPALTITMQVLLGTFFGLTGVALATPLTAVLVVLVAMLYVQDVLGDPVRTPSEQ